MTPAAFYCVADERYFLGAVGLLNSLRLLGHAEPFHLLDCGLADEQRELIAPHVNLVPNRDDTPPWLLKTVAPLRHPAEVMVLIDADMVVTRRLDDAIETAADRVVAVINDRDHFMPEWGELLGLGPVRRQPYVSSGLVFAGERLGGEVLALMDRLQDRVDFDQTFWRRNVPDYPFLYGDQDVLNAILASDRVPPERFQALEHRLAPTPPFGRLRVLDEERLRCAYPDGTEPYAVHHFATKPWLEPTHHGVYSRLLRRALIGSDLEVAVDPAELPLRLRAGLLALIDRKRVNAAEQFRWHVREPLSALIESRREGSR